MKFSIGHKILGIFGVAAGVSLIGAVVAYRSAAEVTSSAAWVTHTYEVEKALYEVRSLIKDAETGQRGFLITGEERYLEPYDSALRNINQKLADVTKLTSDNPRQQQRLSELGKSVQEKLSELAETLKLRRASGFEPARRVVLTDRGKNSMDRIRKLVQEGIDEESSLLQEREAVNRAYSQSTQLVLAFGGLLTLLMFVIMAIFVRRKVIYPLAEIVQRSNAIAAGNLRHAKLAVTSDDEIGELAASFNAMNINLSQLASQNLEISKNLATAAAEVLASIQQQAAATKQQAASVQETTTTMEEIGQSGAQISQRAREVASNAEETTTTGNSGLEAVQNTNRTMVGVREQVETVAENIVNLSERNQAIAEIIATVNDIAEQSNLLALNAAIEAAAAGDQGRSFSVVANEIKNLANQAKDSTIQVKTILGEIQKGINNSVMLTEEAVKRAESGKQQSDVAEQTIRQLTQTTQESIGAFQQIVGATNQQQIGFEQITQALKSIRMGAEQTAASTNQLEKAALSMNALGQQLQKSAERYQI